MSDIDYSVLIKRYREHFLITQEELAKKLGVSYVSVNRWENKHFEPTMKAKRKLKELLSKEGMWEE